MTDDDAVPGAGSPMQIVEQIRDLIARGSLSPGVHLQQTELAKRLGVSRLPVREALKLLTAECIILHDPNRGFFISNLSSGEARQLYRIRHIIETELLSTVKWPTKDELTKLRVYLSYVELALRDGNGNDFVLAHRAFHEAIFALSPNKMIFKEVRRLMRLTDRYRSVAQMTISPGARKADSERHLMDALSKRNRAQLLAVFETDRTRIEKGLLHHLEMRGL